MKKHKFCSNWLQIGQKPVFTPSRGDPPVLTPFSGPGTPDSRQGEGVRKGAFLGPKKVYFSLFLKKMKFLG